MIPAWISWRGLGQHAAIGAAVTLLSALAHAASWLAVLLMLTLGVWHEWSDGDLTRAPGAPWNGLLDVGAFLVPSLLWWGLS